MAAVEAIPGPAASAGGRARRARLRDGTPVQVRDARPDDSDAVRGFVAALSRDSIERRFYAPIPPERAVDEILSGRSSSPHVSLLVETVGPDDAAIVGHGEYVPYSGAPQRAEVAFLVADDHQGQGVGTLLLLELARRARAAGVRWFEAIVLPDNPAMVDVFTGAGFPCTVRWQDGELRVTMDIAREPDTTIVPWTPRGPRRGSYE